MDLKRLRELSIEPGLPLVTDGATIRLAIDELAALRGELARLTEEHDQYARGCNEWNEKFEAWRAEVKADAESARSAQQAQIRALQAFTRHAPECELAASGLFKDGEPRQLSHISEDGQWYPAKCTCGLSALLIPETPSEQG